MSGNPPPGWYPDPNEPELARYWDGKRWTDYTGPRDASSRQPRTPPPEGATSTVPAPPVAATAATFDSPKRLSGLAWAPFIFLALTIVAGAVEIPVALSYADKVQTQIDHHSLTYHEATDAEDSFSIASGFSGFAGLAAIVAFLVWWYRAYSNLPGITGKRWRFGRGWSIGAWFIPIFNLWRPKQIGNDIWRGGDSGVRGNPNWTALPVASLVHWWWALFLLSSILGGIAGGLMGSDVMLSDSVPHAGLSPSDLVSESDLRLVHAAAVVNAASSAMGIIAAVTAIVFVKRASDRQDERIGEAEAPQVAT